MYFIGLDEILIVLKPTKHDACQNMQRFIYKSATKERLAPSVTLPAIVLHHLNSVGIKSLRSCY